MLPTSSTLSRLWPGEDMNRSLNEALANSKHKQMLHKRQASSGPTHWPNPLFSFGTLKVTGESGPPLRWSAHVSDMYFSNVYRRTWLSWHCKAQRRI